MTIDQQLRALFAQAHDDAALELLVTRLAASIAPEDRAQVLDTVRAIKANFVVNQK